MLRRLKLRDPVWQGIGAIIGVLAIVVSVLLAYDGYRRAAEGVPRLEIRKGIWMDSLTTSGQQRLSISFDDQPLVSLWRISYTITNSGGKAILPGDFIQPLQVTVESPWRFVSVSTTMSLACGGACPEWVEISANTYEMKPMLLNPGDYFGIDIRVATGLEDMESGSPPDVTWTGRVANVSSIVVVPPIVMGPEVRRLGVFYIAMDHYGWDFYFFLLALLIAIFGLLAAAAYSGRFPALSTRDYIVLLVMFLISFSVAELFVRGRIEGKMGQEGEGVLRGVLTWFGVPLVAYLAYPHLRGWLVSFLRSVYRPEATAPEVGDTKGKVASEELGDKQDGPSE